MKILGFNHGLAGDAVISTIACRVVKELYPNSELTFSLSQSYASILPLFECHPYIDNFHIWRGNTDSEIIDDFKKYISLNRFDIIFNPFPVHSRSDWYNHYHYGNEVLRMHHLPMTNDLQACLNPYFGKDIKYKDYVTISAFPSKSTNLSKTLTIKKWEEIVSFINKLGYKCLLLGGKYDLPINGAENPDLDFKQAAQALYSSRLQITTDTSFSWIGSAYQHNVIGLFGCNYPDMLNPWSHFPVNPNSKYLWRPDINDIPLSEIFYNIEQKLK